MRAAVVVALLGLLAHGALAHSVLSSPAPWNSNPSKTNPCGGGTPTAVTATYQKGSQITITWRVIAGDGTGPISANIDLAGDTNFNTPLTVTGSGANPTTTGTFTAQVQLPDAVSSKATLQIKSSSNWYSCASIALSATAPAPTTTPSSGGTCIQLTGLTFCSDLNGVNVQPLAAGKSATSVDSELRATHENYLANPNVFQPQSSACSETYRKLLCAQAFVRCGATNTDACATTCRLSNHLCNLQDSHADLYPCDSYSSTTDVYGICSSGSLASYSLALLSAAFAAVFAAAF